MRSSREFAQCDIDKYLSSPVTRNGALSKSHSLNHESLLSGTEDEKKNPIIGCISPSAAKRVIIGNVESIERETRMIADADVSRQLGMIRESIDPSHRHSNNFIDTDNCDFNNIIEVDRRMSARSTELEWRRNTFWKSCCDSVIDRRATVFFTQVAIGVIVAIFAMSKIWRSEPHRCSGDDPSVFIGLISMILGWFAPAPSMK